MDPRCSVFISQVGGQLSLPRQEWGEAGKIPEARESWEGVSDPPRPEYRPLVLPQAGQPEVIGEAGMVEGEASSARLEDRVTHF